MSTTASPRVIGEVLARRVETLVERFLTDNSNLSPEQIRETTQSVREKSKEIVSKACQAASAS